MTWRLWLAVGGLGFVGACVAAYVWLVWQMNRFHCEYCGAFGDPQCSERHNLRVP